MKFKLIFLFALIGGILGLTSHLIWHFRFNIELFNFGPHAITGTLYTIIGIIIGIFAWYLLNRRDLKKEIKNYEK